MNDVKAEILHAVTVLGIDLNAEAVASLVEAQAFIDIASIFEVGSTINVLTADGKIAKADAEKIAEQVRQARQAPLEQILDVLHIDAELAKRYGSMADLQGAPQADLTHVCGVHTGDVWMALRKLTPMLERMRLAGMEA